MRTQTSPLLARLFVAASLILFFQTLQAQDIIILKHRTDSIKAKVTEVGLDEIKYKPWPVNEKDPVIVMDKQMVRQVLLESGTLLNFFMEDFEDPRHYEGQRRNLVKMDILSTTLGVTSLAWEHSIRPGRSMEFGLGLIGLGFNTPDNNLRGAFVRAGYKFIHTPDFVNRGMRYMHLLKGMYVRPELTLVNYAYNEVYEIQTASPWGGVIPTTATGMFRATGGALVFNFGKQYIVDNRFALDLYFGLGAGTQNTVQKSGPIRSGYNLRETMFGSYGFLSSTDGTFSPAIQFGLKAGFLTGSGKSPKAAPLK